VLVDQCMSPYQNEERLKYIEELASGLFVTSFDTLSNDVDHGRKESLE
jgi:hypothetical protein